MKPQNVGSGRRSAYHRQVIDGLVHRTRAYASREEFYAVVDFLNGYAVGCREFDLNVGFHDWLVVRLGGQACSDAWPRLALRVLCGDAVPRQRLFVGMERELIQGLGRLLCEYLDEQDHGLTDSLPRSVVW